MYHAKLMRRSIAFFSFFALCISSSSGFAELACANLRGAWQGTWNNDPSSAVVTAISRGYRIDLFGPRKLHLTFTLHCFIDGRLEGEPILYNGYIKEKKLYLTDNRYNIIIFEKPF